MEKRSRLIEMSLMYEMLGISMSGRKPRHALDGINCSDFRHEYELIKQKKSKLSANDRKRIIRHFSIAKD